MSRSGPVELAAKSTSVRVEESNCEPGALPFQIQDQQQTSWCWAAVAASVTDYFHMVNGAEVKAQCELASKYAKPSDCCADPSADGCDCPGVLETVLDDMVHCQGASGAVGFDDIVTEIGTRKCPVCCKIAWPDDANGHYVVIMGCHDDGSKDVIVLDPIKDSPYNGAYTLDTFDGLAGGSWSTTIKTK